MQDRSLERLRADGDAGKLVGITSSIPSRGRSRIAAIWRTCLSNRPPGGRGSAIAWRSEADVRGADQVYWFTEGGNAIARWLRVGRLTGFVEYRR